MLKRFKTIPYRNAIGSLVGGQKVLIVRHGKKYFATHRLKMTAKEVRKLYKHRQDVEEVLKEQKSELGLCGCQSGCTRRYSKK